ncbi:cytochrome-c oxidase, cbb3-type subunit III [Pseudomaricurvus hydrocarbonicus]|uniref:cytochrome-c oxidase, cbb3-type subunit III n=1 Tax=Pseudomaricurvus hydrocarbonicus TaxID=1470433 RepID=UPI001AA06710|nr:cytochrome-c oxidase, cbb3-type subunit III [Aestuariicella hydrocarbonica]
MSTFWSLWIIVLTTVNLVLLFWVLMANRKVAVSDESEPENATTGHVYDGIEEYDNPLPKWWFYMFLATFVFTVFYLIAYPGMGSWKGILGWTSHNQLEREQQKAEEAYGESFSQFADMPIEEVAQDPRALKMGVRLFANNCAVCHGADAGGNYGFPNLTDDDWLYGGDPESLHKTITDGRSGAMPPWGPVIGEENVQAAAEYVLQISGQEHDAALAATGQQVFAQNCAVCHGADGKGSQSLGAPNLTDDIWLYEGTPQGIRHSIRNGRSNQMPAQKDKLRADKIHLLAAYVYSLSQDVE